MANLDTPRRQRRGWNIPRDEDRVSVKTALHSSVAETSIVISEASTPRKRESRESEAHQRTRNPRGVAWNVSMEDQQYSRPDPSVTSSLNDGRKRSQVRSSRSRVPDLEPRNINETGVRQNAVFESVPSSSSDAIAQLNALRPKCVTNGVRISDSKSTQSEPWSTTATKSKGTVAKDSLKRILSGTRTRYKSLKSRTQNFAQTIELLSSSNSVFQRASDPDELAPECHPEEVCVIEVQQAAYDRWEKAVSIARQALEEAMEAEKILSFAAEFEQLKGSVESRTADWDVGVDRYLKLYRALQEEYPETAPIQPSRIQRHKRRDNTRTPAAAAAAASVSGTTLNNRVRLSHSRSSIPLRSRDTSSSTDPNVIRLLGRRFAHAAECWFLRVINHLVGADFQPSVYCREDCYSLMESLRKVQNWLVQAKGRSRVDRNEALLTKLRETIIQWSSKMIRLPPAKTVGHS
eukprot:g5074.t1